MAHDFPHLNDSSFPNVSNVNVYNPANEVDYEREYNRVIAKITLLTVPWDVGLVHVGQAQIGGVGHVWYAGSKEARNAWFENRAHEQGAFVKTWETEYRRFHAKDLEIKLEISATEAAKYNYCMVEYYRLPHETEDPTKRLEWWGFFVREWQEESADVSTAVLLRDAWQTFIYDMQIPYMFLTRGHAPMSKTNADAYLQDPVQNNEWLLAPDVDYSNGSYRNAYQTAFVFNDEVYACAAVTGFKSSGWGTPEDTWTNAGSSFEKVQSVSSTDAILAMEASQLETFLTNVDSQAPQFKQNISAVFFIGKKLVSRGSTFSLFGVSVGLLNAQRKRTRFVTLSKDQFGYDEKYADIAKLYTQPYAHLEITTDAGETIVVNIEDTHGEIDLSYSANLVYPFLGIDAHLLGVGGGEDHNLTFMNIDNVNFDYGGAWYGTLKRWEIPTFAVVQPSQIRADYQTWYLRQQQALEASTARADTNAQAETTKQNTHNEADANYNNEINNINRINDNVITEEQLRTDTNTRTNNYIESENSYNKAKVAADAAADAIAAYTISSATNEALAATTAVNVAGAALSSSVGNITSGASALVSGGAVAVAGAGISSIGNSANAFIGAAQSSATTAITISTNQDVVNASLQQMASKVSANANYVDNMLELKQNFNTATKNKANTTSLEIRTRNKQTDKNIALAQQTVAKGNANNSESTAKANATRDYSTAISAIENALKQAQLEPNQVFGAPNAAISATTKPQALFASIVTQSKSAIAQAGDEFLRYGYNCNRQWHFEDWLIMPKFTFWQCSEIWIKGLSIADAYADEIRFFLMGGVTVWRNPEDIGNVSIYNNK